jgi:uncharacterized protein
MPKIEQHATGTFCWVELGTTDQVGAKNFYSSLFGWAPMDLPMGPVDYYTMFILGGSEVAAAYTMRPEEMALTPPHWNLYIAVESADQTANRAASLGAKVIAPPFDVMTFGRMSVIEDPTGAVFCIWQARDHTGMEIHGETGAMCWADLSTPEPDRARQFYEALFGWQIGPAEKYPPDYLVIRNGETPIGGIAPALNRNPNAPPHWKLFFQAGDVDALAAQAKALGGAEHMPPTSIGGARLAVLADPQGAAFSIIQPPQPN